MELNGTLPLSGWAIVITCGRTFVGKLDGDVLDPAFDLQSGLSEGPQGIGHMLVALPVLGFGSIRRVDLPRERIVFRVEDLSAVIRGRLSQAIDVAGKIQTQIRAAESGIVTASGNAKLPPMPGRQ